MALPKDIIYLPGSSSLHGKTYGILLKPDWDQDKDYPYCQCARRFVPLSEGATECVFCLEEIRYIPKRQAPLVGAC